MHGNVSLGVVSGDLLFAGGFVGDSWVEKAYEEGKGKEVILARAVAVALPAYLSDQHSRTTTALVGVFCSTFGTSPSGCEVLRHHYRITTGPGPDMCQARCEGPAHVSGCSLHARVCLLSA